MRFFVLLLILLTAGASISIYKLKHLPQEYYLKFISGQGERSLYEIESFKPSLLSPLESTPLPEVREDYQQLWREFAISQTKIPLPYRHPLYNTLPEIGIENRTISHYGLSITNPEKRTLIKIMMYPPYQLVDISLKQNLYRLPFFKNKITKFSSENLWRDLFQKKISSQVKNIDEMIYNLYILNLRHEFFPTNLKGFFYLPDEKKAVYQLDSKDKDRHYEMVMDFRNEQIFSYLMITDKKNSESMKLRNKFMKTIGFNVVDPKLAPLLQTEFKQLNYNRQIDQDGMLILYSAWTQDPKNADYLREMIFYLERGRDKGSFLSVLYKAAYLLFGKTFATKDTFLTNQDQDISLQAKIEIETLKKQRELENKIEEAPAKELTPDEKLDQYLKKAKENKSKSDEEVNVH